MTDEEKKAADTAAAEEAKKKADADAAAAAKAAEDEANANSTIDYKAELAKEREKREKAEKELADKRFKEAEAKRKKEEEDVRTVLDEGDKPLTSKDLEALENRLAQKAQKEFESQRIKDVAASLAGGNADLAELILETHKNRVFAPDLTIEGQLEEVYALVHGRKSAAKAVELARALRSRDTSSRTAPGTQHGEQSQEEPALGSSEAQALKDAGLIWDPIKRAYKKPVGKKTYYFDPKTKKRWTA